MAKHINITASYIVSSSHHWGGGGCNPRIPPSRSAPIWCMSLMTIVKVVLYMWTQNSIIIETTPAIYYTGASSDGFLLNCSNINHLCICGVVLGITVKFCSSQCFE